MATQLSYNGALDVLRNTDSGREALGKISPGELGWSAVGGVAGAAGGYMLAKLLHRAPSKKRRAIYAALGALLGAGGTYAALGKLKGGEDFNGSLRDKLRVSTVYKEPVGGAEDGQDKGSDGAVKHWLDKDRLGESLKATKAKVLVSTGAGLLGYNGHPMMDVTGLRRRNAALERYQAQHPDVATMDIVKGINNKKLQVNGLPAGTGVQANGAKVVVSRTPGQQRGDNMINAAANAALAYVLMSGGDYLYNTLAADTPTYRPELDIKNLIKK